MGTSGDSANAISYTIEIEIALYVIAKEAKIGRLESLLTIQDQELLFTRS